MQGVYYVLLPDGRLQKVAYTVDGENGYVAHVTYESAPLEALPPPPQPSPVPQYNGNC